MAQKTPQTERTPLLLVVCAPVMACWNQLALKPERMETGPAAHFDEGLGHRPPEQHSGWTMGSPAGKSRLPTGHEVKRATVMPKRPRHKQSPSREV